MAKTIRSGTKPRVLEREPRPGLAEAAHDPIGDVDDAVLVAERVHGFNRAATHAPAVPTIVSSSTAAIVPGPSI